MSNIIKIRQLFLNLYMSGCFFSETRCKKPKTTRGAGSLTWQWSANCHLYFFSFYVLFHLYSILFWYSIIRVLVSWLQYLRLFCVLFFLTIMTIMMTMSGSLSYLWSISIFCCCIIHFTLILAYIVSIISLYCSKRLSHFCGPFRPALDFGVMYLVCNLYRINKQKLTK